MNIQVGLIRRIVREVLGIREAAATASCDECGGLGEISSTRETCHGCGGTGRRPVHTSRSLARGPVPHTK